VLAAILTVIPFWLVMGHVIANKQVLILVILALAVVQIFVHIVYFLHLDTRSEAGWNMMAFIFTAVLVIIVLGASIWVMYNENVNMMPMSPQYQQHPISHQPTGNQPPQ
jgi:cytochrome o ubiquinol oxidase operon protein cyoD